MDESERTRIIAPNNGLKPIVSNLTGLSMMMIFLVALASCESGAVVFAPTAPGRTDAPARYTHPSGAFALTLPGDWALYEQNTTTLATASFAAPGDDTPTLVLTAFNAGQALDSAAFGNLMAQYQTQLRPDLDRYTEQSREAMGDGSWRMTGLRLDAGGATQQVNTFIEVTGSILGIADITLPSDPQQLDTLQTIVNSFEVSADARLDPAPLSMLTRSGESSLSVLRVSTWTTPAGVFFVTGEVANLGATTLVAAPVHVALLDANGLVVGEAADVVMGYGVPPGSFAPFSLRFGQGQPSLAVRYVLTLGGAGWRPETTQRIVGAEALAWTDESSMSADGRLTISGTVTNTGDETIGSVRAVVTVFDRAQKVVAAGFTDVGMELAPDESVPFQLIVSEMGAQPVNYIVTIQGIE